MRDCDYVKIDSVNPLYLNIDKLDWYIEEKEEIKYLTLVSRDKNKYVLKEFMELWDNIKNIIKKRNNKPGELCERFHENQIQFR